MTWPVVQTYAGEHLEETVMPVGGIGTGCIGLGATGRLRDWEIFNRPGKGLDPQSFFALRVNSDGQSHTRLLEGPLPVRERAGHLGSSTPLAGLPRFESARLRAAFPFAQIDLEDAALPVDVRLEVFNPFVPGDADASGYPAMIYRVVLANTSHEVVDAALCGSIENIIGRRDEPYGGSVVPDGNQFTALRGVGFEGLLGRSTQVDGTDETWGTLALAVIDAPVSSRRTTWQKLSWGDSLLDFWDDFSADGLLDEPSNGARVPTASVTTGVRLESGTQRSVTFVIAWHTPNRRGWKHDFGPPPDCGHSEDIVGNHYAGRFENAGAVIADLSGKISELEENTTRFVRTITDSDLPIPVQDAALSNLAVLKSPTCFRIEDGTFLAWEGCNPTSGSCHGSCTHVWNYQYALEQLFPDLAWTMREVEFGYSTDQRGHMSFRAALPLGSPHRWAIAAADGQMGTLLRLHRTWKVSGATDRLNALWSKARLAMEFAWIPNGWDADQDGVMEGCQHNTMDVEYYGPNGVGQSWYLGALAACADMATAVGDEAFAARCRDLRDRGARATDDMLFNGEFYEQRILPPISEDNIAPGLRIRYDGDTPLAGSDDLVNPDLQIGSGCGTDQLVGNTMADACGLSTGLNRRNVLTALTSISTYNHRDRMATVVNHLRTYATGEERGLVNCSFPKGGRPQRPFPYCFEVWTGFEYTAAAGLAAVGSIEAAEQIVATVRDRFDGRSRNPFNEIECGNHYVRSMASFGLVHAWSVVVADVHADVLQVHGRPGRWPVVAGGRFGVVTVSADGRTARYEPAMGATFNRVEVKP